MLWDSWLKVSKKRIKTRDIVFFIPKMFLCQNLRPTLPTMQFVRWQFDQRYEVILWKLTLMCNMGFPLMLHNTVNMENMQIRISCIIHFIAGIKWCICSLDYLSLLTQLYNVPHYRDYLSLCCFAFQHFFILSLASTQLYWKAVLNQWI